MSLDKLPVGMFDIILLALLAVGIWRGRKHGMSEELMMMIKWIVILIGCALVYEPLGGFLADTARVFSRLASYIVAYILCAALVLSFFALIKHAIGGKLIGSDIFGSAEYYLGMGSGFIRFTCMILAVLAVLNARYYSPQEVSAELAFQNDVYGSHYFPGLHSVQATVFENSISGKWIKDNLSFLLIKPTAPENKELHQKEYKLPGT